MSEMSENGDVSEKISNSSSLLSRYEQFVIDNQWWYMWLPWSARFFFILRSTERTESLWSALNLLQVYHDSILGRPPAEWDGTLYKTGSTERKSCDGSGESLLVGAAKQVLTTVGYTQVLLEMLAGKLEGGKWRAIALIESVKAICKLILLRNARKTGIMEMLLPMYPEDHVRKYRERDAAAFMSETRAANNERKAKFGADGHPHLDVIEMYAKHGRTKLAHGEFGVELKQRKASQAKKSAGSGAFLRLLGELLYIARPVVYVVTKLCVNSKRKWTPLLASIATDVLSQICSRLGGAGTSRETRTEMGRRRNLWMYYLLLNPLFSTVTINPILAVRRVMSKIPFFGTLFIYVLDLLLSMQQFHFYTAPPS